VFLKCERNLKRIAAAPSPSGQDVTENELKVRINVMSNLATEIQDLSKSFRSHQREFFGGEFL